MYREEIAAYVPQNQQELGDKEMMLEYLRLFPDDLLTPLQGLIHLADGGLTEVSHLRQALIQLTEQGQIVEFQLRFRSYADSGTTSVVLPERQAMAAMEAKGHGGEELLLVYLDSGEELVSASWAAARALDGGR